MRDTKDMAAYEALDLGIKIIESQKTDKRYEVRISMKQAMGIFKVLKEACEKETLELEDIKMEKKCVTCLKEKPISQFKRRSKSSKYYPANCIYCDEYHKSTRKQVEKQHKQMEERKIEREKRMQQRKS